MEDHYDQRIGLGAVAAMQGQLQRIHSEDRPRNGSFM
jgi:hypothetical protein